MLERRVPVLALGGADGQVWLQVEQLEDPVAAAAAVVGRCEARQLMALYKVPGFEGPDALMRHIASARGKLRKGGLPDIEVTIFAVHFGLLCWFGWQTAVECYSTTRHLCMWRRWFTAKRGFSN